MSPLDRLLTEAIPIRPTNPARQPWTDADRDAHWNALCTAVGTPGTPRPSRSVNDRQKAA
ncbi:hypothetical protein ACWET9_24735 [Streptomyces sp. NPDC004059]